MAKRKSTGKTKYTSKGQRPNVARKTKNAMHRDKKSEIFGRSQQDRLKMFRNVREKVIKNKKVTEAEMAFYERYLRREKQFLESVE